jgi:hypothetical protein
MPSFLAAGAWFRHPGHPFLGGFPSREFGIYVRSACCCALSRVNVCGVKAQVGLRLDATTLAAVDVARGDVPRNRWIERVLEEAVGRSPADASGSVPVGVRGGHTPSPEPSPRASVAPLAEPRRNEGPYGCPTPLCQKRGAKGEPCPRHGVPMTFKL